MRLRGHKRDNVCRFSEERVEEKGERSSEGPFRGRLSPSTSCIYRNTNGVTTAASPGTRFQGYDTLEWSTASEKNSA